MDHLATYLLFGPPSHVSVTGPPSPVVVIWTNWPRTFPMDQLTTYLSYGPPTHITVVWYTAVIFTRCKTYSFIGLFLIPRYNQALIYSIYRSVAIWLCCVLLYNLWSTTQLHLLRYLAHNTPSQLYKLFPWLQRLPHREHSPKLYLNHDNRGVTHSHKSITLTELNSKNIKP